jgi:hypothetical protein
MRVHMYVHTQVQAYLQLLANDSEQDVRSAAAKNLGDICTKLDAHTVMGQVSCVMYACMYTHVYVDTCIVCIYSYIRT